MKTLYLQFLLHTCCAFEESSKSLVDWSLSSVSDGTWTERNAARLRTTTLNLDIQQASINKWFIGLQLFSLADEIYGSVPIRNRRPLAQSYGS